MLKQKYHSSTYVLFDQVSGFVQISKNGHE